MQLVEQRNPEVPVDAACQALEREPRVAVQVATTASPNATSRSCAYAERAPSRQG